MSRIYLPTSEQMEETLIHLDKIAGALGSKIDLSSWKGIQQAVRSGLAPELLPIGTQLTVSHDTYGDIVFDVVAHDYFKSAKNENAHTMTLMCHNILQKIQADGREAFYYADSELPAGTYNFTNDTDYGSWGEGTYQITLTKSLPQGGQLFIDGYTNQNLVGIYVKSYADRMTTEPIESVVIANGSGGNSLGTFGSGLNHIARCAYGSNNYKESAIRQFLNSSAEAGSVWTPQTKFDRPPSWGSSLAGFVGGFNDDFVSVIGEVIVPCSTNDIYESPDSMVTTDSKYTVVDKFYPSSQREIIGKLEYSVDDDSIQFPYYAGSSIADRIKYRNGLPSNWRTRTPCGTGANGIYIIQDTGSVVSKGASDEYGIVPVCTIV